VKSKLFYGQWRSLRRKIFIPQKLFCQNDVIQENFSKSSRFMNNDNNRNSIRHTTFAFKLDEQKYGIIEFGIVVVWILKY
jgi:hypothetical protein